MNAIKSAYQKYCKQRFVIPTEQEILDIEQRIGAVLPDDYRTFLTEYNGGTFNEPRITPTTKKCPRDRLTFLHGIRATFSAAVLASDHDVALFDDNFPVALLPIGYTMMGGLIILETDDEGRGEIFLKEPFGDFYYLCKGIESFFERLADPPTEGEMEREAEEWRRNNPDYDERFRCKVDAVE